MPPSGPSQAPLLGRHRKMQSKEMREQGSKKKTQHSGTGAPYGGERARFLGEFPGSWQNNVLCSVGRGLSLTCYTLLLHLTHVAITIPIFQLGILSHREAVVCGKGQAGPKPGWREDGRSQDHSYGGILGSRTPRLEQEAPGGCVPQTEGSTDMVERVGTGLALL